MEARGLKLACAYVRTSTLKKSPHSSADRLIYEQNPEAQEEAIRVRIAARGWSLTGVYADRISGAKERRPGLDRLMADARSGKFSAVVVARFDRFSRSTRHLITVLEEFQALGIDFISLAENLDTSTPLGMMMFTLTAGFAQMERSLLRERILVGMEQARIKGTKSGHPVGRPHAVFDRMKASEMRAGGESWRGIATKLGVGMSTLQRALQKGDSSGAQPVLIS